CLPVNVVFCALIIGSAIFAYSAGGGCLYGFVGLAILVSLAYRAFPLPIFFFDAWESEIRFDSESITLGFWPEAAGKEQRVTSKQSVESLSEVKHLGRCIGLLFRNGQFVPVEARLISNELLEALIERARKNWSGWGFFELAQYDLALFLERISGKNEGRGPEDSPKSSD
ncbi:MAG: hypothetical protein P1V97_17520, partial [Planctomycetota bacterium]|nr:hypothetical protein [Planctomycetota bacterium]